MKLLDDLYQEFFSMLFDNFLQFKKFYVEATKEQNTCLHFSLHLNGIDINVKNWNINKHKDLITLKPTTNHHKEHKKDDDEKPKSKLNMSTIRFVRYKPPFRFKN